MNSGIVSREQMKLLLKPAHSHTATARRFDMSVSWVGLLGAALIYASINIPAIIAVSRAGDQRLVPTPLVATVSTATAAQGEPSDTETPTDSSITTDKTQPTAAISFTYDAVGISAPVEWNVPYSAKNIAVALQSGLAHVKGSAVPGESGTSIITGHSSNVAWARGAYKTVFAPLLKSKLGDQFSVTRDDTTYRYEVTEIYEVDPARVDLLNGSDTVAMRLITCTPLGSDKRRLIIDAKQIDPAPAGAAWQANSINAAKIVATR